MTRALLVVVVLAIPISACVLRMHPALGPPHGHSSQPVVVEEHHHHHHHKHKKHKKYKKYKKHKKH